MVGILENTQVIFFTLNHQSQQCDWLKMQSLDLIMFENSSPGQPCYARQCNNAL